MKPLKIVATLHSPYIGGNEIAMRDITRGLSKMGYRFILVVETNKRHADFFKSQKWISKLFILNKRSRIDNLVRYLKKQKPDALLNSGHCSLSGKLSIALGIPSFYRFISPPSHALQMARFAMITSEKIITVSDYVKKYFDGKKYPDAERIYEGCDVKRFRPVPAAQLRDKNPVFSFGILSHLVPYKRHDLAIRALNRLKMRTADFRCYFIGKAHLPDMIQYKQHLKHLIMKYRLQNNVIFHGFTEDPVPIINMLDAFIFPAVDEGFGISVVEVMACGKPVIANHSGAFPELVSHGRDGLLMNFNRTGLVSDALLRIMTDAGLRKKLGQNARKSVCRKFSIQDTLKSYDRFFRNNIRINR